jgi:xanthine dehydrogenase YagR molybdenum-binding subunit
VALLQPGTIAPRFQIGDHDGREYTLEMFRGRSLVLAFPLGSHFDESSFRTLGDVAPWSSKSLRACYVEGAKRIGWGRRTPKARSMRDGELLVGMGMSAATYPAKRMPASAVARLLADGTVVVQAATHEFGTGTYTSMSQVAADALGVPVARVRFELGDSNMPENPISAGSMTASSTGPAVQATATALRARVEQLGGTLADLASCRSLVDRNGGPIEARADAKPGDEQEQYSMHSFGAVFAEVRVDPDLGQVRVAHLVGAYGVGRILNQKTARSQMIGGIVYGLGMALFEETAIDARTGRYLNADLAEYHLPVNADVPDIDVIFVDEHEPHVNPIGVKGIGEIGKTGVAAAVANAVHHATGVRVRDLPITLDKLLPDRPRAFSL